MNNNENRYAVVYCYDRTIVLLGMANTFDSALEIMKSDFLEVVEGEVTETEIDECKLWLTNNDWEFSKIGGRAWANKKGNHDWAILDTESQSVLNQ